MSDVQRTGRAAAEAGTLDAGDTDAIYDGRRCMKILLATVGSAGDVNPFIAIGEALAQRGHEVVVLTNPHFRSRIEAAGLSFIALGTDADYRRIVADPDLTHPRKGPWMVLQKLMLDQARLNIVAMRRLAREMHPDIVVTHHIASGVRWVCEHYNIPCATVVLAPLFWMSRADPGIYLHQLLSFRPPPWWRRFQLACARPVLRLAFDRRFNRLRSQFGFVPQRDLFYADTLGGVVNLGLWSPAFRPPMPDDPPNGTICGFAWYDRPHEDQSETLPEEVERFLDAGDPPVIFTIGTTAVHHPGRFFDAAVEACGQIGRRVLLLTGPNDVGDLPDHAMACAYAPFSELLPRGCATVNHGGIGTTAQALRAGTPNLVVPFANDQWDNARRVEELGVGRKIKRSAMKAGPLAGELDALLTDPSIRDAAARLGEAIRAEANGAEVAAGHIESVAQAKAYHHAAT